MTVAANSPSVSYAENGVTLAFAVPFRFLAETDLVVKRIAANGSETTLVHGSEWSASGGSTDAGGTVTLVTASNGTTLNVTRSTARAQQTDYATNDTFPAETHEAALDRAMLIDQEQDVKIDAVASRAILVPIGEAGATLPSAALRKGKYMGFDPANGAPQLFEAPTVALVSHAAVSSITALAAIATPAGGQFAQVFNDRTGGPFEFVGTPLTSEVTADPGKGKYVAPASAPTGVSGAWVRKIGPSEPWRTEWHNMPSGGNDSAAFASIEAMRGEGRPVHLGAGTYQINGQKINMPGHFKGFGKATIISHNGANPSTTNTFGICTSGGTKITDMAFTGLYDSDNADAQFPINISPRINVVDTAEAMEDFEAGWLWLYGCDTGIRMSYGGRGPSNDVPGTTWYFPVNGYFHDITFACNYQDFVPEGDNITLERAVFNRPDTSGNSRPFAHCIRAIGYDNLTVKTAVLRIPAGAPSSFIPIGIMGASVDNGLLNVKYRYPKDGLFENIKVYDSRPSGYVAVLFDQAGETKLKEFQAERSMTDTNLSGNAIQIGAKSTPVAFGKVELVKSKILGWTAPILLTDADIHSLLIAESEFVGNARTGGIFDGYWLKIEILATNDHAGNPKKAPRLIELYKNMALLNPSMAQVPIWLTGSYAAWQDTLIVMRGNKFPEAVVGTPPALIVCSGGADPWIDFDGTGAVRFSTLVTNDIRHKIGDNSRVPAGTDAAYRSNFRATTVQTVYPQNFA